MIFCKKYKNFAHNLELNLNSLKIIFKKIRKLPLYKASEIFTIINLSIIKKKKF
jgi:uncharacterized protein with von Willebrand factor type A (vWA) domain